MRKILLIVLLFISYQGFSQSTLEWLKTNSIDSRNQQSIDIRKAIKLSGFLLKHNKDSVWLTDTTGVFKMRLDEIIIPTESDPYWHSDSAKYSAKSYVKEAIHDSIANISTRVPELMVEMSNDSTVYEMTTTSNPYVRNIAYTIRRPFGCKPITSIKVNSSNYSVPAINEGQTVTGNLSISFPGPANPAGVLYLSANFVVAVAASRDTVKQTITLNQAWCAYFVADNYDPVSPMNPGLYLSSSNKPLLVNGICEVLNFNPDGNQLIVALPAGYDSNQKAFNGITTSIFKLATQTYYNVINTKGAVHRYEAFYTNNTYLQTIQKIEIR